MATPHVRHQLHLHRSQIGRLALLGLLALAVPLGAQAQKKSRATASRGKGGQVKSITVENLPGYDDKWFHPGFYIAPHFSRFNLEQSPAYIANQGTSRGVTANAISSPGFSVGFVGDARLGDYFNLRFAPGVSFITREIEFKPAGYVADPANAEDPAEIVTQEIGATQVDFPVLLKFHSERRRNTRVYVVGGLKPSVSVGNRRKDPLKNKITTARSDMAIEYGVGLDLFYPFFKFAPELRFSHGLNNLYQAENNVYSQSLQSLKSNTVTLYLTFE
ncbi:type IX secretion/gliding motility protein PorT/SprT [Hymenobacter psychrotolerans]|uniref:Probable protein-translocating porin PorT n=1 Tax=Hymenobacter psychrotolerans DSM 18569 TaxID=1121959 RepID=A0A1M6SYP4_9BACT|nr:porin family protein [Hymenobacter psychrotolerans]SHK49780.1 probable protein-translocating porin PorT [Hymenobacter psychrotolerans DSM 18569]